MKLDAELHDAQEDESNAAHASSMKVQNLTDAVANGQTGVSRSKGIISPLEQVVTTSTVDRDANRKKVATGMVRILLKMPIKEARRKDGRWMLTQQFSNIISLKVYIGLLMIVTVFNLLQRDMETQKRCGDQRAGMFPTPATSCRRSNVGKRTSCCWRGEARGHSFQYAVASYVGR